MLSDNIQSIPGIFFFFFKCNRAHVCTLLGITNRLKVVVEAGEEHLYAA